MPRAPVVAFLIFLAQTPHAGAVLQRNGNDDAAHRALGGVFAGRALTLKVTIPPGYPTSEYIGAVYLNSRYGLTAAHAFDRYIGVDNIGYEVLTGANYLTSPGATAPVSDIIFHPNYAVAPPSAGLIDLAIIRFAEPLAGDPATIDAASVGENVTAIGLGQWGTPASGLKPRDGFLRGWHAPVDVNIFSNAEHFFPTNFNRGQFPLDELNGQAAPGDAGGGAYDDDGNLLGIISSRAPPFIDDVGQTFFVKLAHPDVYNWLVANTQIPEPATSYLVALAYIMLLAGHHARRPVGVT